jgi:hypothetical protein
MASNGKKTPQSRSDERSIHEPIAITQVEYGSVQEAYDYFNAARFDGALSSPISGTPG